MSKWADREYGGQYDDKELLRFALSGQGDEWSRLQGKIFAIVDSIATRVQESTDLDKGAVRASAEAMKDLSSLAAKWARAKVERPSLENEKLRAEIVSEFAEAKRRYAEAMKAEAEAYKTDVDARNAELVGQLDALERLMKLAGLVAHMSFERVGNDGHLLIGPKPDQLGEPDGDAALLEEREQESGRGE